MILQPSQSAISERHQRSSFSNIQVDSGAAAAAVDDNDDDNGGGGA